MQGNALLNKGLLLFAAALLMSQRTHAPQKEARISNDPGFAILAQAGQLKTAGKYADAAIKALDAALVFQQNGDWLSLADCCETIYQYACDADSADFYRTIITHFTEAGNYFPDANDAQAKAKAVIWGRLGSLHHILGEYETAVNFYERAFPFAEQAADSAWLPRLYGSAASVFWLLGDDYRALTYNEKALSLAELTGNKALTAAITANLGNVWRTLDPIRAVPFYRKALSLDPENSETLMLLSKAYLESGGRHEEALAAARASLRLAVYDVEKSDALHQMGRVQFARRQYDRAIDYYTQALPFAEKGYGIRHPECAKIYIFTGNALLAQKQVEAALTAFNQTLSALLPLFSSAGPDQNPKESELTTSSLWVLEALLGKARAYEIRFRQTDQTSDLRHSLACSELALAYLQKIKLRYGDDQSKLALNDYAHPACEAAVRVAFNLFKRTGDRQYAVRAFQISEQTKAVVLTEALYRKEVKRIAGVSVHVLERERRCHEQIALFEKKLAGSGDLVWKDSLFYARRQQEAIDRQLTESYPAYREALLNYRAVLSPDSVRQQLPADVALLAYTMGDSAIYTFLLSKDTFWIQEQTLPPDFKPLLMSFYRCVSDWQFSSDSSSAASRLFLQTGRRLYTRLLEKPLSVAHTPRLFIVPDGILHFLPFELLLTRDYAGQWIDRETPFLLKEKAVSYRFSCKPNPTRRHTGQWGGFGIEYDDNTLSAIDDGGHGPGLALRNRGKLPYAKEEILAVTGILGGSFWLNQTATRTNFLQNAERFGILHLAMHGFIDQQDPMRSRLLFSKSVADDNDPFVYASDLYSLQLTAGLAVLSSCQSGAGKWKRGEGIMSLARAFAFAGCPSLIMSLWNVSDRSTSDLMVSFYQQLKAGKNKDEALRIAKLQYLENTSPEYVKPVFWAGFVPVGEMDALPESYFSDGGWGWWAWRLGALFAASALLWILWRRRFNR